MTESGSSSEARPAADALDPFAGRRVLVTGGLGFIGSAVVAELVRRNAVVTVLDCLVPEHGGNPQNIEVVREKVVVDSSDMRDASAVASAVRDQEFIFHVAGQVSHGDSMKAPMVDLGVNCIATMNLVEACREFNPEARIVYTSTRQVYGIPRELPVTEQHPTIPIDVNGINKLAAEYYHLLYQRSYGVRSCVLRLTNTYGPRQQIRNDRQGFAGILIRRALRGETVQIYGTGGQIRDFNYVDDVVDALLRSVTTPECFGAVWNLGAPRRYSVLDFVDRLASLCELQREIVPFPLEQKIIDIGDYYGDYSAFTGATGWQPAVDLDEGLARTIEFYRGEGRSYWQ